MTTRDEDDLPPDREVRWYHRVVALLVVLVATVLVIYVGLRVGWAIDALLTAQLGAFESRATGWVALATLLLCKIGRRTSDQL